MQRNLASIRFASLEVEQHNKVCKFRTQMVEHVHSFSVRTESLLLVLQDIVFYQSGKNEV